MHLFHEVWLRNSWRRTVRTTHCTTVTTTHSHKYPLARRPAADDCEWPARLLGHGVFFTEIWREISVFGRGVWWCRVHFSVGGEGKTEKPEMNLPNRYRNGFENWEKYYCTACEPSYCAILACVCERSGRVPIKEM